MLPGNLQALSLASPALWEELPQPKPFQTCSLGLVVVSSVCLSVCSDSSVSPGLTSLQTAPRSPLSTLCLFMLGVVPTDTPPGSSVLKVFPFSLNPAHPLVHNNPLKCLLSWPASLTNHRFQAYLCLFPEGALGRVSLPTPLQLSAVKCETDSICPRYRSSG